MLIEHHTHTVGISFVLGVSLRSFMSYLFYGAKELQIFTDESVQNVWRCGFNHICKRKLLGERKAVSHKESREIAAKFRGIRTLHA